MPRSDDLIDRRGCGLAIFFKALQLGLVVIMTRICGRIADDNGSDIECISIASRLADAAVRGHTYQNDAIYVEISQP